MSYRIYNPSKDLSNYIRFFWTLESSEDTYLHRSYADTCCELIFIDKGEITATDKTGNYFDHFPTALHAQTNNYSFFESKNGLSIFGVYFYPYGIIPLIQDKAQVVTNNFINCKDLLKNQYSEIAESILLTKNVTGKIELISNFYRTRLTSYKSHYITNAIKDIIDGKFDNVSNIARKFNMSERNFTRKFSEYAGFNPQTAIRISRFQNTINSFTHSNLSLTEIALQAGYFDQAHFIRDFKTYSGYKPSEFFKSIPDDAKWLE